MISPLERLKILLLKLKLIFIDPYILKIPDADLIIWLE